VIDPKIEQGVWTTEAAAPVDPTFPLIVPLVQVTAPPLPGAALKTAKFAAEPSPGALAASTGVDEAPSIADAIRIERDTIPRALGTNGRFTLLALLSNLPICLQLAHRTRAQSERTSLRTWTLGTHGWIVDLFPVGWCEHQS
jgi:hypothetical protein